MRRVLLTLFLVGTLAGSASAAEYRPAWWPPSCKGALPCHNPANVKANTAFASGKTQDIVPLCDKINYAHEPAITMPDMYLICAKAGNVRKMGQMAWYYHNVDYQPDLAYHWAYEGAEGVRFKVRPDGPWEVHPDSQLAWRELCSSFRWGMGTPRNLDNAERACALATGQGNTRDNVAAKWFNEIEAEIKENNARAEGAREMMNHPIHKETNKSPNKGWWYD